MEPLVVLNVYQKTRDRVFKHMKPKERKKKYDRGLESVDDVMNRVLDLYEKDHGVPP